MDKLKIHFLNTIWSDAIILENNGHYAFVDTGSKFYFPMIEKHINDFEIKKIDFILLTHFHSDHYGNIINIINNYIVDKIYLKHYYGLDGSTASGYASNEEYINHELEIYNNILKLCEEKNINIIFIDEPNSNIFNIDFEGINLELYDSNNLLYELYTNPSSPAYNEKRFNENFNSIGVFIQVNGYNIFLGGDATCSKSDVEEVKELSIKMINRIYKNHNIDYIDIYKSCHHGGTGTNTKELCALLKSKYAIITNTARWLDTYSTFDNLKAANENVNILVTDHQKYIFEISDKIEYKTITDESLFLILNLN